MSPLNTLDTAMKLFLSILILVYNLIVVAGTAYLVEIYHWNPWWFAFSLLLLMSINLKEK